MLLHQKETSRLRFRNITNEDYTPWLEFLRDEIATKFFNKPNSPEEMCRDWIERCLLRYENDGHGLYALNEKNSNEFIGMCGLMLQEVEGKKFMEVGYHLFPKYWKKGFATEAAVYCRDFGFENNMALDRKIISLIHTENFNSQAVAKRNGMKLERVAVWREVPHCIFAISTEEWSTNHHRDASR